VAVDGSEVDHVHLVGVVPINRAARGQLDVPAGR